MQKIKHLAWIGLILATANILLAYMEIQQKFEAQNEPRQVVIDYSTQPIPDIQYLVFNKFNNNGE